MARRKKSRLVKGAVELTAGGAAFATGASVVGSLPHTQVTATASRSLGLGSVTMPIAAGGMVLRELDSLERLGKKKKRR